MKEQSPDQILMALVSSYKTMELDTCNYTPLRLCTDYMTNRGVEYQSPWSILLTTGLSCKIASKHTLKLLPNRNK